jgi:hypothetical protein
MAKTKPKTYAEAAVLMEAARKRYDEANDDNVARQRRLSEIKSSLRKAVADEDFAAATALKTERDTLTAAESANREKIRTLASEFSEANKIATDLYFKENGAGLESDVIVRKVVVVDPRTGNNTEAVYTDSSDNVSLSLSGKSFDSEAYHIGEWAAHEGFLARWTEVKVRL